MNQLGHFEENLLTELRAVVAAQPPQPRRALPRKRIALATAGVGLLAAGLLVGIPAMRGTQAPAAYAVTPNDDGTVTISVSRLEDPEGLERELATYGIEAEVDFAPPGMRCAPSPPRFEDQTEVLDVVVGVSDRDGTWTVRPADVEGKTLIVEGWRDSTGVSATYVFTYTAVSGPVAPCVLEDVSEPAN